MESGVITLSYVLDLSNVYCQKLRDIPDTKRESATTSRSQQYCTGNYTFDPVLKHANGDYQPDQKSTLHRKQAASSPCNVVFHDAFHRVNG